MTTQPCLRVLYALILGCAAYTAPAGAQGAAAASATPASASAASAPLAATAGALGAASLPAAAAPASDATAAAGASGAVVAASTSAGESDIRGRALHAAVEARFKEVADAHAIKASRNIVISDVFLPFIPVGTSFDAAEALLKAAGFSVLRANSCKQHTDGCTHAELVLRHHGLFGKTTAIVDLTPALRGHWDLIGTVEGILSTQAL